MYLAPVPETYELLSTASLNNLDPVGASVSVLFYPFCPLLRLSHRGRLTLAQHDQPPDWDESGGSNTPIWIVVGIVGGFGAIVVCLGIICLLYICCCIPALDWADRRRKRRAVRARADEELRAVRTRADEEFAVTPLSAPPPTLTIAPPP